MAKLASDEMLVTARAEARKKLPCPDCGSTAEPRIREPKVGSVAYWDDPSCYMGCAECGRFLALLDSAWPFIWQPEVDEYRADESPSEGS